MSDLAKITAQLAVELWKVLGSFERAAAELPASRHGRIGAQLRFSRSRLDALLSDSGLRLVTFEGQLFGPNLPVSALNAEDLPDPEGAIISSTIEPAVVSQDAVVLTGKVYLTGV